MKGTVRICIRRKESTTTPSAATVFLAFQWRYHEFKFQHRQSQKRSRQKNKDRQTAVTCSCSTCLPAFQHLKKTWRRSKIWPIFAQMTVSNVHLWLTCYPLIIHMFNVSNAYMEDVVVTFSTAHFSGQPDSVLSSSSLLSQQALAQPIAGNCWPLFMFYWIIFGPVRTHIL